MASYHATHTAPVCPSMVLKIPTIQKSIVLTCEQQNIICQIDIWCAIFTVCSSLKLTYDSMYKVRVTYIHKYLRSINKVVRYIMKIMKKKHHNIDSLILSSRQVDTMFYSFKKDHQIRQITKYHILFLKNDHETRLQTTIHNIYELTHNMHVSHTYLRSMNKLSI